MTEPDLSPPPSRLVESLRDTGYSYEAAFADIVDNSIAASADIIEIGIEVSAFDNELSVSFYDNGEGMTEQELINAMRYGSDKRESPKSLGKFGMGLKTASTAFCRRLTVISMKNGEVNLRTWDLDTIKRDNAWKLETPSPGVYADQIEHLKKLAGGSSGTAVIWEKVDRLIKSSGQDFADKALDQLIEEVSTHLGAVFGKFLLGLENFASDQEHQKELNLSLNGVRLDGWDPTGQFLNTEEAPKRVLKKKFKNIEVDLGDGLNRKMEEFELNAFVLPNKNSMSEEELEKLRYGNDNQGFYIYRENRLIYGGGWPHRLYTKEPHLNLLRIELNFDHQLDEYFQIDIRKTRIILPQALRKKIKELITPIRNEANKRYREGARLKAKSDTKSSDTHSNSSNAVNKHSDENRDSKVTILDPTKGSAEIENNYGTITVSRAKLLEGTDVLVTSEEYLDDGALWNFALNEDGEICVVLNSSHQFYERFYNSSSISAVMIQAMDCVFWSLANAEIGTMSDKAKRNIEDLRFKVSRYLRNLADELPDVE